MQVEIFAVGSKPTRQSTFIKMKGDKARCIEPSLPRVAKEKRGGDKRVQEIATRLDSEQVLTILHNLELEQPDTLAQNSIIITGEMAKEVNAFDVVIVGGGTAGLVLASRLSEDPALQVLVLEAGLDLTQLPEQLKQAVLTPAANTQLYKTPVDWNLKTVPQVRTSFSSMIMPW